MLRRILGIDPSSVSTGYAIIEIQNNDLIKFNGDVKVIKKGCLALKGAFPSRCHLFHSFFTRLIDDYRITSIAIETPFVGKNILTYGKLSYFRGLIYLLSFRRTLYEYAPCTIKKIIAGKGNATKEDVANSIRKNYIKIPKDLNDDITDAIAVALSALIQPPKQ